MRKFGQGLLDAVCMAPVIHHDEQGHAYGIGIVSYQGELGVGPLVETRVVTSLPGALRSLSYQLGESQGRLVVPVQGTIYSVVCDVRRSSPSFGKAEGLFLSSVAAESLWVPPGYAHGYYSTTPSIVVIGSTVSTSYARVRLIRWDDPQVAAAWPLAFDMPLGQRRHPILSPRDISASTLRDAEVLP